MATDLINLTYPDANGTTGNNGLEPTVKEDILDIISNISPKVTPFISGIPSKSCDSVWHEWLNDVLAAPAANTQAEGHADTHAAIVNPTRNFNITQILRKDGMISETQMAVIHAGYSSRMAYEVKKKTVEWKNDLERVAILGAIATGASGTARQMNGALAMITSVTTALSSASLSETIYNSLLNLQWGQYEADIDEVYVGGFLKSKISSFTAGATKNINSADKRLTSNVDVYEGDNGVQKIFRSRTLNSTGASTATMMMIDSSRWALAYLRKPKYTAIPNDGGDRERFKIIGEATLESLANGANVKATGLSNVE